MLYLGSDEGLYYYDGYTLNKLKSNDSLDNHEVTALYEDEARQLWIGDNRGQIFILGELGLVEQWEKISDIQAPVIDFQIDSKGGLWVATYGQGVFYYLDDHTLHFTVEDQLLGEDIYALVLCEEEKAWIGTDNGISVCSISEGQKEVVNITREDGLPDEIITEIILDEDGNLWLGTDDKGACHFNTKDWKVDHCISDWSYGAVNSLTLFEEKELWIGTKTRGLWKYDLDRNQLQATPAQGSILGNKIFDLHKDTEGNLWVLSNSYKLCSSNRQFDYLPTTLGSIQSIWIDAHQALWAGTQEGLFKCLRDQKGNQQFQQVLPELNLNVISLYEDEYENIWIGTFGEGLYIYNPKTKALRHIVEKDGLTNGSILSIASKDDRTWMATLGGVTEIIGGANILETSELRFKNYNHNSEIGANFIYKIFIDTKDRVWFGTDGKGVSVLEDGRIRSFTAAAEGQDIKSVYSITEDGLGKIWISTDKEGIFEFDGEQFRHFSDGQFIRNMDISSLASDQKGNLVIIHDFGLDVLHPVSRQMTYFGTEVGLETFKPNLNAVFPDQFGSLWIGTQNQVVKYSSFKENFRNHPQTTLRKVSVYMEPIDFHQFHKFKYNQNNLLFDFSGTWFSNPAAVSYQYKLEGHDQNWIATKDRQAIYSNLLPGNYEFRVNSSINGTFLPNMEESYTFTIQKPFWLLWWFILLVLGLGFGIIWWLIKMREYRLQREAMLKKEKVESQFEALKSQINPHFLFNCFNTLIAIIEENPNLAIEYVEKLSDYYRNIIQYRKKDVIELSEEMTLVESYTFLLKERYGDNINLDYHIKDYQAFVAPLTLQMLVENAVKHNVISKSKPLYIKIEQNQHYIYVSNNLQPKLVKEVSTGFGLQNINNRYALLVDKNIKIEETKGEFKVGIPIIKLEKV